MINMDYCKFENTLAAMRECLDALYEGQGIGSQSEYTALLELREACEELLEYKDNYLESLYDNEYEDEDEYYNGSDDEEA